MFNAQSTTNQVVVVVAFFLLARVGGGGRFDVSFPACAVYYFKRRSARAHEFHFLDQDQSTVAQRAEMTVAECSLTGCL